MCWPVPYRSSANACTSAAVSLESSSARSVTEGISESGVCIRRRRVSLVDSNSLWSSSTTLTALRSSVAVGPFVANSSRIRMISSRISLMDSGRHWR